MGEIIRRLFSLVSTNRSAHKSEQSECWISGPCFPRGGAWSDYIGTLPPKQEIVEFFQQYTGDNWIGKSADFHPEMNVAGLWWRKVEGQLIEGSILNLSAAQSYRNPE
jgi:hypothetical protein